MTHAGGSPAKLQTLSRPVFVLATVLMAGEWVLLVTGTHLREMIVGAASVLGAALFLYFASRSNTLHMEFRAKDIGSP
jgi:hypothetical protein